MGARSAVSLGTSRYVRLGFACGSQWDRIYQPSSLLHDHHASVRSTGPVRPALERRVSSRSARCDPTPALWMLFEFIQSTRRVFRRVVWSSVFAQSVERSDMASLRLVRSRYDTRLFSLLAGWKHYGRSRSLHASGGRCRCCTTVTEGAAYCCTKVEHPRLLNHSCSTATATEPRPTLSTTPVQAKDSENVDEDNWWRWRLLTDGGGGDHISSRCYGRR